MSRSYVHGYDNREGLRLHDQAATLVELLHSDTTYPAGHSVLEVGCGVGAQTMILGRQNPNARFTSIDVAQSAVAEAGKAVQACGLHNVTVRQADIFDLPFAPASFDHVFVCFVLEHLPHPAQALQRLKSVLKMGGTMTVIEGDHGSACFYPESAAARKAIQFLWSYRRGRAATR